MDITMLKSGFWGYKKDKVCEYIANLNGEFSDKLMETVKNYDHQIQELNTKIAKLEAENLSLLTERNNITQILGDATDFANDLKAKAEKEDKAFREENEARNKEQQRRIESFQEDIDQIRNTLHNMLRSIDKELTEKQESLSAIDHLLKEHSGLQSEVSNEA